MLCTQILKIKICAKKFIISLSFDSVGSQSNNKGISLLLVCYTCENILHHIIKNAMSFLFCCQKFSHNTWDARQTYRTMNIQFTRSWFSFFISILFTLTLFVSSARSGHKMNFSICCAHSSTETARLRHLLKCAGLCISVCCLCYWVSCISSISLQSDSYTQKFPTSCFRFFAFQFV